VYVGDNSWGWEDTRIAKNSRVRIILGMVREGLGKGFDTLSEPEICHGVTAADFYLGSHSHVLIAVGWQSVEAHTLGPHKVATRHQATRHQARYSVTLVKLPLRGSN